MRPKSGLPKRKALRRMPKYEFGFKKNPNVLARRKSDTEYERKWSVASMFTGCGGFDLGAEGGFTFLDKYYPKLPFELKQAYEIDKRACETYKLNISENISCCDLVEMDPSMMPYVDILTGGFPCQDFSSCGPKKGLEGKRGKLYEVMVEYMKHHQPKVVIGENVPFLLSLHNGEIVETILKDFRACGYDFSIWKIYCPDFGLPQSRTRIFLVGFRSDLNIKTQPIRPTPTHVFNIVSINEALHSLEKITDETVTNQSQYFVSTRATAGAGQGDQTSKRGELGYAVRANPKGRVHFHYELDRRLTVRETARLQSFPDEFVFPHAAGKNFMEIGNAVPPIIGHQIMTQIEDFLHANNIPPGKV